MTQTLSTSRVLLRPVVKLVAGVVGLLLLEYIILALPMVKELPSPGLSISIPQIVSAIIATVIIILLINFGIEISQARRIFFSTFRSSGTIVHTAVVLATIPVAYQAYQELAQIFLGKYLWAYSLAFLVLTLLPLIYLVYLCYINLDKLADMAVKGFPRSQGSFRPSPVAEPPPAGKRCSKCDAVLAPGVKFCRECGTLVAQTVQEPPGGQRQCPKCGTALSSGVAFCSECGTPVPSV